MIDTIYIENSVLKHPRSQKILARFPKAQQILCERYSEVFNPKAQNFRLQKQKPALILAQKYGQKVLPIPNTYGIGGENNYYFSHMLNCVYDCRYCFLQGMYSSANYVLFVNYEDFIDEIKTTAKPEQSNWFFSGYDCDSLALDPLTQFLDFILDFFSQQSNLFLELRTKSTQIRGLLNRKPSKNVITAFSFTPDKIARALEHGAPNIQKRIAAMHKLAALGWPVGIRLDPMIDYPDYQQDYKELIQQLFSGLNTNALHSISLGNFRLPTAYYKTLAKLYPDEPLFATDLVQSGGIVSYGEQREKMMLQYCTEQLLQHTSTEKLYACEIYN